MRLQGRDPIGSAKYDIFLNYHMKPERLGTWYPLPYISVYNSTETKPFLLISKAKRELNITRKIDKHPNKLKSVLQKQREKQAHVEI